VVSLYNRLGMGCISHASHNDLSNTQVNLSDDIKIPSRTKFKYSMVTLSEDGSRHKTENMAGKCVINSGIQFCLSD
jgi:hypothetical protein